MAEGLPQSPMTTCAHSNAKRGRGASKSFGSVAIAWLEKYTLKLAAAMVAKSEKHLGLRSLKRGATELT